MITIRQARPEEAGWLQTSFDTLMGWTKPPGYFAAVIKQQAAGEVVLALACDGEAYCGHCKVVWRSAYSGFQARNIPEIQDLNVRPDYRRRGIGGRLLDAAECVISARTDFAGIGFGLYADYGAAQRLYIKRGYVPDGRGVAYGGEPVAAGGQYAVDDNLALYLVKRINRQGQSCQVPGESA